MAERKVFGINIPTRYLRDGEPHFAVARFRLGPGPCGKTVSELAVRVDAIAVQVDQYHDDGSAVALVYPADQLTGRIEIQYERRSAFADILAQIRLRLLRVR